MRNMKKIATLLTVLLLSFSLSAATSMAMLGMSGGYSTSENGTGLLGFNSTAQYVADFSNSLGIGFGTHADITFGLGHRDLSFFFGFITGPGFEFRIGNGAINLTVGPAIVLEESSFGFGVGVDALYTYYFDQERTIGLSIGGSFYPQFIVDDSSRPDASFNFGGLGYVGITWRARGFALDPLDLAPLGYLIY